MELFIELTQRLKQMADSADRMAQLSSNNGDALTAEFFDGKSEAYLSAANLLQKAILEISQK